MVTGSDEMDVSNQGLEIQTSRSKIVQDITDPLNVPFHSNETTTFNTREKFQCLLCNKLLKTLQGYSGMKVFMNEKISLNAVPAIFVSPLKQN